jgi:micrococcal nuclease
VLPDPHPARTARCSAFIIVLLFATAACTAQSSSDALRVARVIDGDTFELSDGQRVRLIGIDTPEKHSSSKLNRDADEAGVDRTIVRALGELASKHAETLVSGQMVHLEYDQANSATGHRDRYGRTLAFVHVLASDGTSFSVNERMIADGYANAYVRFAFDRRLQELFVQKEREAREARRGLWSDSIMWSLTGSPEPQAVNSPDAAQDYVFVTGTGTRYHMEGCRHLSRGGMRMLQAEAARTRTPCSVCIRE